MGGGGNGGRGVYVLHEESGREGESARNECKTASVTLSHVTHTYTYTYICIFAHRQRHPPKQQVFPEYLTSAEYAEFQEEHYGHGGLAREVIRRKSMEGTQPTILSDAAGGGEKSAE